MMRHVRSGLAVLLVVLIAACGESPTGAAVQRAGSTAALVPGTCTTQPELIRLSKLIFTESTSPNIGSVKGKIDNLDHLVRKGKFPQARERATEIVAFTLKHHNEGRLAGSDEQVRTFTNAVLCFAGIDIDVEVPDNTFLIQPSDTEQVVTNVEGTAGVEFPANPVSEPTLITFELIPDTFQDPGAGPLQTKLDQYPGFIRITKSSPTNAPLTQPVVVGVCPQGVIPADVRARLRLGHGASFGFEVTPSATVDFLTCPTQVGEAPARSAWDRLVESVLPTRAHAYQSNEFGGGVGGTVTEFSPLAPVDPQLEFGGGVGGTVTEFVRVPFSKFLAPTALAALVGPCPNPIEAAVGSPVRDECRPFVTLRTRLGTPFFGVPVDWNVTVGGGTIAANTGACGTFGTTAATTTGPNGGAGICWTLGALGANQVRAVPRLGGDAVEGVTFSRPEILFDAIANPPAGLVWSQQPAAVVQTYPALTAAVTVVDKNGERVFASTDRVIVRLNQGTFHLGQEQLSLKAVAGIAAVQVIVPTPGEGYQLLATAPIALPTIPPAASSVFRVIPGAPYAIVPVSGDGASAPTGSTIEARVRLVDRIGTPIPNTAIDWSVVLSGPGSITPPSSVTNAAGEAAASWTLGLGSNFIRAATTDGSVRTRLTATGTAP